MNRILIVDDDLDICSLMLHFLKDEPYVVTYVLSAEEALERLKFAHFDLIISDILMPGMNGIELTRLVKEKYPHLKIVVCSEGGTTDAKEIVASIVLSKAVEFGAISALSKPFAKKDLVKAIESSLNGTSHLP